MLDTWLNGSKGKVTVSSIIKQKNTLNLEVETRYVQATNNLQQQEFFYSEAS